MVVQQQLVEERLVCGDFRILAKSGEEQPGSLVIRWCPRKKARALPGVALPVSHCDRSGFWRPPHNRYQSADGIVPSQFRNSPIAQNEFITPRSEGAGRGSPRDDPRADNPAESPGPSFEQSCCRDRVDSFSGNVDPSEYVVGKADPVQRGLLGPLLEESTVAVGGEPVQRS